MKVKTAQKAGKKGVIKELNSLEKFEGYLKNHSKKIFVILSGVCLLFSFLLFNVRVSEGGDDSTYIKAGYDYSKDFFNYYFSFNAPFYPMFLSLPIFIAGINIFLLKLLSVVFNFVGFLLFYKAFKNRIPYSVLFAVLLFYSCNSFIQYFASQTYNEAFYFFWQSLFFVSLFILADKLRTEDIKLKSIYANFLLVGFLAFLLTLTKNIALPMVPAIAVCFVIYRQWKNALVFIGAFLIFKLGFEFIKTAIWGSIAQYESQGQILLAKDPYNISKGYDDFWGFVGRFFDNCNLYLSKRFFQILGFRPETGSEVFPILAILVIALVLWGLLLAFRKKNLHLSLTALFTGSIVFATFVVLQTRWDQHRMILIHMPVMLLLIFYAFYNWGLKSSTGRLLFFSLAILIGGSTLISSIRKSAVNIPILKRNLNGDIYAGYTPDWINFLKMSSWCEKNLPKESLVASRKAPMSFLYANGKEFYPVYKVLALDTVTKASQPDSLLAILKRDKVTHMLIASLRVNPTKNSGQVINTLHKMIQPIQQKYPQRVRLVHTIGETEPAYLYEIK